MNLLTNIKSFLSECKDAFKKNWWWYGIVIFLTLLFFSKSEWYQNLKAEYNKGYEMVRPSPDSDIPK